MTNETFSTRATAKRNEYLLKTEDLLTANKSSYFNTFKTHFCQICTQIHQMQTSS